MDRKHKRKQKQFKKEIKQAQKEYESNFGKDNNYYNIKNRVNPFNYKKENKIISTIKNIISKIFTFIFKLIILIVVIYLTYKD